MMPSRRTPLFGLGVNISVQIYLVMCRDLDSKLASTEAQVNELRAHLASGSHKPSPVFRVTGSPIPGPFQQQSSMIPR